MRLLVLDKEKCPTNGSYIDFSFRWEYTGLKSSSSGGQPRLEGFTGMKESMNLVGSMGPRK